MVMVVMIHILQCNDIIMWILALSQYSLDKAVLFSIFMIYIFTCNIHSDKLLRTFLRSHVFNTFMNNLFQNCPECLWNYFVQSEWY